MEWFMPCWRWEGIGRGRLGMALWRFDHEGEGGEQGGGTAGVGQEGGKEGEGSGQIPPPPKSFTITVDGQKRTLTEEEIVALASKGAGAEKRFEEAAEIRKKAARGITIQEAVDAVKEGRATKVQVDQMLELMGIDPEDVPNYESMYGGGKPPASAGKKENGGEKPEPITMERLAPEVREILDTAREQDLEKIRTDIEGKTRDAVYKDGKIGQLLSGLDEKSKAEVMDELFEMAKQDVREGILARNQLFGPELLDTAIQRLRHRVERLGIPAARASQPSVGSGPMPFNTGYGQYPLGMQIPDKTVDRVPVTDPDYITRVTQRALQNQQKALRTGTWK